jgi:V/A-type H+-transporting ATPase subunit G/H
VGRLEENVPPLLPVRPGRSALPAFRPVEEALARAVEEARREGEGRVAEAKAEAERIRREGEERLKEAVREGEQEALRQVEDRSRDRVGEARREVSRRVDEAEARIHPLVEQAVRLLIAPPDAPG